MCVPVNAVTLLSVFLVDPDHDGGALYRAVCSDDSMIDLHALDQADAESQAAALVEGRNAPPAPAPPGAAESVLGALEGLDPATATAADIIQTVKQALLTSTTQEP